MEYIKSGRVCIDKTKFADMTVTYHDPCNYGRRAEQLFGKGFFKEPRWILSQCIDNWVDLYPAEHRQLCCGGGGGALTSGYNDERVQYGSRKMDQIKATGAQMIVVPCHSCHGQLNNLKSHYGFEDLTVKYLWELVADCLNNS